MLGVDKRSDIVYDSHGRGRAALKSDIVSMKPNGLEKKKEFLPLGFKAVWAAPDEVPKGLH